MLAHYAACTGEHLGDRRTGRSTAQALHLIAEAIENPRQPRRVTDHHRSTEADRHLLNLVRALVRKLELDHFRFSTDSISFGEHNVP